MKKIGFTLVLIMLLTAGCTANSTPPTRPQRPPEQVLTGSVGISPGQVHDARFEVKLDAGESARLEGTFSASGGADDVEAFLFDDDGYVNWTKGLQLAPLYK